MKKLSFFLMAMLFSVMSFAQAETYSYTFTKNVLSTSGGPVDLGGVTWNYPAVGYVGWDSNGKGQQFGSGSNPAKDFTLSAIIPGEIQSITVNAATASKATAYLKVTVGDTEYINSNLSTSSTDYTGTGASSGEIKINFTQTTSKALYIKNIVVVYNPNAGGPVKESVTLNWSASTCDAILGVENQFPTLSTIPADLAGVTYSSSNEEVATINATTGAVELVGGGTTDIIASFEETDDYYAAEAKYTLTVLATTEDTWNLVTDASTLKVGDEVIIAAAEASVAMSTTQNSNNRGVALVVKGENTLTATNQVQVFTLEAGSSEGTFAFNTGAGYLWAASNSSNHLKTGDLLNDHASWTITIAEGVTSVVATNSTNRNVMQYNESSQLFSCYASASQKPLALYKKYIEPEIEWMEMPLEISNLTTMEMPVDDVTYLQLVGRNDMDDADVMLFLNNYTGEEKAYEVNAESSYMTFGGLELTVMDGSITKSVDPELGDVYAGVVHASVYDDMMGETMYLALSLTMYGAEPVEVVVENATVVIEERSMGFGDATYSVLILTGEWSDGETTYPVSLVTSEFDPEQESQEVAATLTVGGEGDEDPWLGSGEGNATIAIVDNTVSVSGLFENQYIGFAANATISGTLPSEEPEVITYELNGGEFPVVVVPTNAELWGTDTADVNGFMHYYNHYYGLKRATQTIENVASFAYAQMQQIMTDEASAYKWLGDYVQSVATAAGKPLSTDMAAANESGWRWSVWAFFNACAGKNGSAGIDFTEAGKPEAWGAAYQAAHAVVLPTEPVAEDYVLPTPVKEGYKFVGWYDNAEGTGEAYTVIPAGWSGTLYAIWEVEGPATALENIAVEGKAVKAIINGQLIIIKNGVQYNAQGAVVK